MQIVTDYLLPNEDCHGLYEANMGPRRMQWVFVVRGDAIAKYTHDVGPSADYADIPPLVMNMGLPGDSVESLQAWAEDHRHDDRWARRAVEWKGESTLHQDIVRQMEQRSELINNRSVFGPAVKAQRDGFPLEHVLREALAERDRRAGVIKVYAKRGRN